MTNLLPFIGRFHPLIVHLPIGFLLLAFAMEAWRRWRRSGGWESPVRFALFLGMASALPAAAMGYLLSLEGGYEAGALNWHQWTGFGVAALSLAAWWQRNNPRLGFRLLAFNVAIVLVAGHYGGVLTHGKNYLWEYAPAGLNRLMGAGQEAEAAVIGNLDSAVVYSAFIQPILDKKCVSCHNPDKTKGRLMLHEAAALFKGGEHGASLIAGKPWESLLLQRIILPVEAEEHMPPEGLPQIEAEELALIQWWIAAGADTTAMVARLEAPKAIQAILEQKVNDAWRILGRTAQPPPARSLQKLRRAGVPVQPIAQGSPLLEVNLSYDTALTAQKLRMLHKIAPQLVRLNLSHTAAADEMLDVLARLPNLIELDLNHTAITDAALHRLSKARHLQSLNLYGTGITDAGLETLSILPALRKLYTWQSKVTTDGITRLRQARPGLEIWNGLEQDTTFSQVQLKAPLVTAEKELFEDSLEVKLELTFGQVDIRYTLDGSEPDSNALKYLEPIVLGRTTRLRARAFKENWSPSEIAEKQFVRVRYRPQGIHLAKGPDERYAGKGSRTLHDFSKGSERFSDGQWIGWEGENVTATVDLGRSVPVSGVTIGALEDTGAWIFFPRGLAVWASADGKNWRKTAAVDYPETGEASSAHTRNFSQSFEPVEARYVRVEVKSQLRNPAWHPNPGQPCWVFLDEVLVE